MEEILPRELRMINSLYTKQFLLFLFVGAFSAAINIISRIIFNQWLSYSRSIFFGYCAGITIAFMLNYKFVFPGSQKSLTKQLNGFVLTNLFFLPIVWWSAIALRSIFIEFDFIAAPELSAHVLAVSIPLIFTFLIYKFSIFK